MSNIPYIINESTITVFLDGAPKMVDRDSHVVAELRRILESDEPDLDRLRDLLNPAVGIAKTLEGTGVEIVNGTVVYRGTRVNAYLEDVILAIAAEGLDPTPWKRFVARLLDNPSERARNELYKFLERGNLPLTPDGCFLAYKRVTEDYRDLHSRKFDNSVGQVVSMPRHAVDDDASRTCSTGLHFCSQDYLSHFYSGAGRIVVVKVDPADVVSIPLDYNFTKGRTWRYEVVGEVDLSAEESKQAWGIIEYSYTDEDWEDDWEDDPWDEDWEDEGDDVESVPAQTYRPFEEPPPPRVSWWRRLTGR